MVVELGSYFGDHLEMNESDLIAKARQFDGLDRRCIELFAERVKPTEDLFDELFKLTAERLTRN